MFEDKDIWLISHSPRRIQLLEQLGLRFGVGVAHVEETYPDSLTAHEVPVFLSRLKADNALCEIKENTIVITADTIVCVEGRILGKPHDYAEARKMLLLLSGKTHQVVTGVSLRSQLRAVSFAETTDVKFKTLTDSEINYYIEQYKPYDKAGAYGIQEWIGLIGVEAISGCFYNVMGLPTARLYEELIKFCKA